MNTSRAFTLIETIVYLALFGLLMTGVILTAYNLFEGAARSQTEAMVTDEGNFLIGKITWALSGTQSINNPPSGTSGSQLSVNKVIGVDLTGAPIIMLVTISWSVPNMTIATSGAPQILNNTNVRVTRLGFSVLGSGSTYDPVRVEASTTVPARSGNGMVVSRDFFTVGYLRK